MLLAAVGGALHFLGYVGHGIWPLAFVSLVPLLAALEASRPLRWPAAALVGFVFGEAAHAGGYPWLWRLVDVFLAGDLRLGAALWLAHSVWFAFGFALYGAAFRALRGRGWPLAAAALPPLLVLEWRYPLLFPGHLGDALVDRTALVQVADLGGPLLVSALAALVNVAVLEGLRWRRGAPLPRTAFAAALSLALAFGYGTAQIRRVSRSLVEAPALRLGVVQGNLGVLEKRRDPGAVHRGYLEQTRELLAAGALDLVVWPETVYSRGLSGPFPVSGLPIRQELRVPLLFGGVTLRPEADGRRAKYNSALLVGADGVIRDVYDKNLLVPFAEALPFAGRAASLAAAFPHAQAFAAGEGTPPLSLGPWRIATPICSESAEPALVRRMAATARPHLFVSLANDGWFGDSAEPWIHLAVARMRALEHKRYFVHATNTGVSAVVDPLGRIVTRSGLLTRESLRAEVRLLEGETLYGRLGDWPGWLAAAALAAGLILRRPGARTARGDSGT